GEVGEDHACDLSQAAPMVYLQVRGELLLPARASRELCDRLGTRTHALLLPPGCLRRSRGVSRQRDPLRSTLADQERITGAKSRDRWPSADDPDRPDVRRDAKEKDESRE